MKIDSLPANETQTIRLQTYFLYNYPVNFVDIVTISILIEGGLQSGSLFLAQNTYIVFT